LNADASKEPTTPDYLKGQPFALVERDGVHYTLLGTAHVSRASVEAVEAAIASGSFDAIAVELDAQRHLALTDPDALSRLDLFQIIREGKTGLVAANLALAAYQRRLAEQLGVEPGAELKAAALLATARGLPLYLIDRNVGTTLKRAWHGLGWWSRSKLMAGMATSLIADEQVEEHEIEKLKQGDMLESSFGEFAASTPVLYEKVIAERDRYMAARLREHGGHGSPARVLAVIGAGHLAGLQKALAEGQENPQNQCQTLDEVPSGSKFPWLTLILAAFLVGGFAWGYYTGGAEFAAKLVLEWVLITGIGGALGCIAAGGHPLSVIGAFLASPVTPLHPALSSGMVSAFIEAWLRKPTYADFLSLRDDTGDWRGWWRNRVARVLVNFFLTNMGTALAVWLAGAKLITSL